MPIFLSLVVHLASLFLPGRIRGLLPWNTTDVPDQLIGSWRLPHEPEPLVKSLERGVPGPVMREHHGPSRQTGKAKPPPA
jgi:hypothetical protein